MPEANPTTTTVLLAVLAAASVLQVLLLIATVVFCYRLYRRTALALRDIEQRQLAPLVANARELMTTVDAILGDVKGVTGRVTRQTMRVDAAIDHTLHRVDEAAGHARESVLSGIGQLAALAHGARSALASLLGGRRAPAA